MPKSVDTEADLGEVRHPIDIEKLENYLCSKCPQHFTGPIAIKQFGFGQSNPSYQIVDAKNRKYVLRKQPPGKLLSKSAHRVDREFYMLKSLQGTGVPVPKVFHLCEDVDIIGTMFYVMEFVQGRIFHDVTFPELAPGDRRECWRSAVQTLARLHKLNPANLGLPENMFRTKSMASHYPRQVRDTLPKVHEAQRRVKNKEGLAVGDIPHFNDTIKYLDEHMPKERISIVHGDYKIDNVIFHPRENRVIAILDWELCTIGHPLADLANLMQPYTFPNYSDSPDAPAIMRGLKNRDTWIDGMPRAEDNFQDYQEIAGWNPAEDWVFAETYAHIRLAIILQGIQARVYVGNASSAQAARYASMFTALGEFAWDTIQEQQETKPKNSKL